MDKAEVFATGPSEWRVEWFDDDGGAEVAVFYGPRAQERATAFIDAFYTYVGWRTRSLRAPDTVGQ